MTLHKFDCFGTIPITSSEIATQIKQITNTIKNLWHDLSENLSSDNLYSPYSDRIHPLFLSASELIFEGAIESTCKRRAIESFDRALTLAMGGDAEALYCELLITKYWLCLGASIQAQAF
jgi:hypothetical protein